MAKVSDEAGNPVGSQNLLDIKEPGGVFSGAPHLPYKDEMKSRVMWRNLPKLELRVRELEQQLKESKANNG